MANKKLTDEQIAQLANELIVTSGDEANESEDGDVCDDCKEDDGDDE